VVEMKVIFERSHRCSPAASDAAPPAGASDIIKFQGSMRWKSIHMQQRSFKRPFHEDGGAGAAPQHGKRRAAAAAAHE
jgi:hypothetical protein